jgi:hypothetical protein
MPIVPFDPRPLASAAAVPARAAHLCDPSPERLVAWTLRAAAFGGLGCVGLTAALVQELGRERAQEAVSWTQILAYALVRGGGVLARDFGAPFDAPLSPVEAQVAAALCAAQGGRPGEASRMIAPLTGPAAPLAARAVRALADAYAAAGLEITAPGLPAEPVPRRHR